MVKTAGFGDPVVGWVLADDGSDQQVMDLLNPCLPSAPYRGVVFVAITGGGPRGAQLTKSGQLPFSRS